jgi:hypothetical protein
MKRLTQIAGATGLACALAVALAPASNAAANTGTATGACVNVTDSNAYGQGQISLCPQSDGTVHVTGYLLPLLHRDWYDLNCISWWIVEGTGGEMGPTDCPGPVGTTNQKYNFDYTLTPAGTITGAKLFHSEA